MERAYERRPTPGLRGRPCVGYFFLPLLWIKSMRRQKRNPAGMSRSHPPPTKVSRDIMSPLLSKPNVPATVHGQSVTAIAAGIAGSADVKGQFLIIKHDLFTVNNGFCEAAVDSRCADTDSPPTHQSRSLRSFPLFPRLRNGGRSHPEARPA